MKRTMLTALLAASLVGQAFAAAETRTLTYDTFATPGAVEAVEANASAAPTLTLTDASFARTITLDDGARPINFNPTRLTVTEITLAFASGTAYSASFTVNGATFGAPSVGAPVTVTDTATGTRTVYPVTYACQRADGVALETGKGYALGDLWQGSGGSQASYYTVDGKLHARVVGTATLDRHVITVDGATVSLADELGAGFVDTQDTVVVVEFTAAGGTLTMDKTLGKAAFVAGSAATENAAVIAFAANGTTYSGPFTLRDVENNAPGRIVLDGPANAQEGAGTNIWNPAAFRLACDLTLKVPLPTSQDGSNWFENNTVAIPAGCTLRLELPATAADDNFPTVRFGDAASRLEVATEGAALPDKYLSGDMGAAGVLALAQAAAPTALTIGGTGRPGTLELDGDFAYGFGTLTLAGGDATLLQKGGTATIGTLSLTAGNAALDLRGGALTVGTLDGFANNTNVGIAIGADAMLSLPNGVAEGNANSSLEIVVSGALNLGDDLHMTPAARRALTLDGGTITATGSAWDGVEILNGVRGAGNAATAENENFMVVSAKGGTLAGNLTVDGVRGLNGGTLTIGDAAEVETIVDYIGTIQGRNVGRFLGSLGDVTLGEPWGGGDLAALATTIAKDYHGTLGFAAGSAGDEKTIDFSAVEGFTELPGAFRVNNHQHITMRLDQYADAVIRWPAAPEGVTLTLIESGAYGGTLTLPHIPAVGTGVTLDFASFDESGVVVSRPAEDFRLEADESGVTDTLTWDDPVFTGKGAWIDVEFNGDTLNSGWFTLTGQDGSAETDGRTNNGLLCGLTPGQNPFGNKVMFDTIQGMAAEDYFTAVRHPRNDKGGLALYYRPYVAMKSSLVYPETWSLSVRFTAPVAQRRYEDYGNNQGEWLPAAGHRCLVAFGNNDNTGNNPEWDNCNALVLATGNTDNEIVLYRFTGRNATEYDGNTGRPAQDATAQPPEELFRKQLADATSSAHTVSVVYDGDTMTFYLDGAYVASTEAGDLEGFRLGRGLQVGAQLGGHGVVPEAFWQLAYPPSEAEGGVIDFIRFYKGALTDTAMQEIADRTPYVRENLRYVRYVPITSEPNTQLAVPEGGETWVQPQAWVEQRYENGAWTATGTRTAEPAEGAECRLLVASGEHLIQVNVARNESGYFYSPNRTYAALVVAPQEGNATAGTVRLSPLGVTEKEVTEEGETNAEWESQVVAGDWYKTTEAISEGNRTGFTYGRLRFTGGADDPINADPAIPDFHGSAYLLPGADASVCGVFDAGVCHFSRYADIVLKAAGAAWETHEGEWVRTKFDQQQGQPDPDGSLEIGYDWAKADWYKECTRTVTVMQGTEPVATYTETWRVWANGNPNGLPDGDPDDDNEGNWTLYSTTKPDTLPETGAEGTPANTLRLVAGLALTRGERDEVVDWQLTGPVVVEGAEMEAENLPNVSGNGVDADETQASLDVWVPKFGADADWKFYDITRTAAADNANGHGTGLFARAVQTPGRLYLDFTKENGAGWYGEKGGDFSAQAWYRYGYEGTPATATRSGMAPTPISDTDFDNAVAFQIRLATAQVDVTLNLDRLPASEIDTFFVEDDAADGAADLPTLFLTGADPLTIHRSVVAEARLDVSNNGGAMALDLKPEGTPIPVHKGESAHGALIVGNATIDWNFGAISSVPRLEVAEGRTLTLTGPQDFLTYDNVLAAQAGATLSQAGESALHGTDVELGEGATFAFQAESVGDSAVDNGVELTGALRLLGKTATLRGSNVAASATLPHFTALGGIVAEQAGATLTVDAPKATDSWHSHTVDLRGEDFGLTKTGLGTVDFYHEDAPSVSGQVRVMEGTLLVAKQSAAADMPIGKHGLHVEQGATLGANARIEGASHLLAHLPEGATLSGGGTVRDGLVRLDPGSAYAVTPGQALTSTLGFAVSTASEEPTVHILLPEKYQAGTVFLIANRREPNEAQGVPNVRRRLLSLYGASGTRWDTTARIENGTVTKYAAQPPDFPLPVDPTTPPAEGTQDAYHDAVKDALLDHYHNANIAYVGAAIGRTQAGTYRLNAAEISDALICFEGIRHYASSTEAPVTLADEGITSLEYVDGSHFCLAYEFGVAASRLAVVDGQPYVVVKVELRNALGALFPELASTDAAKARATFRETTEVVLAWQGGDPIAEAREVTDLTGATLAAEDAQAQEEGALASVRYFRVPYTEANFPAGRTRAIEARARLRAPAQN